MKRMRLSAVSCVALGFALVVEIAVAQSYPVRPVRLIVPGSPGGGNDFVARLAAQKLGERLGQQVIVDNRPSGGGTVGPTQAANAAPDGYTLMLGFVGQMAMAPHAEKVAYDPLKDFTGISLLASTFLVLATHPSLPARSVQQLIAFARAHPGELNYATGPPWSPSHLAPALFIQVTGINVVPVHYKGTGPAALALLVGEAHMLFASFPAVMPYVRAKRLVALGVASPARSPIAPEVPTLVESGVRGAETLTWYSLVAPSATPKGVIAQLHGELVKIAATPDYREQLERQGMETVTSTPGEFAAFLQAEFDKWGRVIRGLRQQ